MKKLLYLFLFVVLCFSGCQQQTNIEPLQSNWELLNEWFDEELASADPNNVYVWKTTIDFKEIKE